MEALAAWSKYTGSYDKWQEIRKRYSLAWTNGNESIQSLERFFNEELTLDIMLQRIKQMVGILPPYIGRTIKFGTLVGLRSTEILESVKLINDSESLATYYNPEQKTLYHYKFKKQFIRSTKKAYLSFVTPDMVKLAQFSLREHTFPTYSAIRHACQKRNIPCCMGYARKVHASWLYQNGIPEITINMLQGRVPISVFARHYFTPSLDYREKVIRALGKLKERLAAE
jgi:hypothetical protein